MPSFFILLRWRKRCCCNTVIRNTGSVSGQLYDQNGIAYPDRASFPSSCIGYPELLQHKSLSFDVFLYVRSPSLFDSSVVVAKVSPTWSCSAQPSPFHSPFHSAFHSAFHFPLEGDEAAASSTLLILHLHPSCNCFQRSALRRVSLLSALHRLQFHSTW